MWLEISLKLFQQLHPIFFHFYLSRTYLALLSLKKKSVTLIVIINVSIKKTNTLGFRTEHHLNQSNHNRAYCTKVVLMDLMPLKKKKKLYLTKSLYMTAKKAEIANGVDSAQLQREQKDHDMLWGSKWVHSLSHERESWTFKTLIGMWFLRAVPLVITT